MVKVMSNNSSNQESVSEPGATLQSPICASLRSKKFFMRDALPMEASDYLDASNHCWCRMTQQVIGPDGGIVNPDVCVNGRACFSSAF